MKLIRHEDEYKVIDSANRLIQLSHPINKLEEIFEIEWGGTTDKKIQHFAEVTRDASSFKQLRHYIVEEILKKIPTRYLIAYMINNRNCTCTLNEKGDK